MRGLAEEANLEEPEKFAQAWHMLMEGSIVSAGEGNRNAARDAKCAAHLEHVPPKLKWQDSHGVLDRKFYRH